ncbi:MAG: hypothetical protein IJZ86_09605 [Bacteroides sp.]|nr:hypothetical protein [Bacteroides sp.]
MKKLLTELLTSTEVPTTCLQHLNERVLKAYKLTLGGYLTIYPKEVEIFYVNTECKPPFVDTNMQCRLDPKSNDEIWPLQSNRFGKLYFHRKGLGGVDICLSDAPHYALCCTLKAAEVNGEACWSMLKVRNAILDTILRHEGKECNKENRQCLMERLNKPDAVTMLAPRSDTLQGDVYHLHRRTLRRRDKFAQLPLRSFMDVWDKGLQMDNVQRIKLYMSAHPQENLLDVLRREGFRYIPAEIKVRYGIDRHTKLYE